MTNANTRTEADPVPTLFARLGGERAIDRLVEAFYQRMDTLPEAAGVRAMHGRDLTRIKITLKQYLTEWTGGPQLFTPQKGHPRMRQRHMHVRIGVPERDGWLLCMRGALDETIHDDAAKDEIWASIVKLADWMRNTVDGQT